MIAKRAIPWIVGLALLGHPSMTFAGMPSPLPTPEARKVLMLNDSALMRLQVISFFLLGFFLSALVLKIAWNFLQRDFTALPRLTYLKALTAIFLLGVLFVIVLTMISGARELMTPGAWKKDGFTYKLAEETKPPDERSESARRQRLEKLRTALWQFSALHQGRFPADAEITTIPEELWQVPGSAGMKTIYRPGQSAGRLPEILVYEPELDSESRLVLYANGDIAALTSAEIKAALPEGKSP